MNLQEIKQAVAVDFNNIPATTLSNVLKNALVHVAHALFNYADKIESNNSPITCTEITLAKWAYQYGVFRAQAQIAVGQVRFSAANGAEIPAQTSVQITNNAFITTKLARAAAGVVVCDIIAIRSGVEFNTNNGDVATLSSSILGIENIGASLGTGGGSNVENLNLWRSRIVAKFQGLTNPNTDYSPYAAIAIGAHPDITDALIIPHEQGVGTVTVRPICNNLTNRIPNTTVLAAADNALQNARNGGSVVHVLAPIARVVDYQIQLPNTADDDDKTAIIAAIKTLHVLRVKSLTIQTNEIRNVIDSVVTGALLITPIADIARAAHELLTTGRFIWT